MGPQQLPMKQHWLMIMACPSSMKGYKNKQNGLSPCSDLNLYYKPKIKTPVPEPSQTDYASFFKMRIRYGSNVWLWHKKSPRSKLGTTTQKPSGELYFRASCVLHKQTRGVSHCLALPFTFKSMLRWKKNCGNSNISSCKKYNHQKNPLKEINILQDTITL
jgi:hypothetical protein